MTRWEAPKKFAESPQSHPSLGQSSGVASLAQRAVSLAEAKTLLCRALMAAGTSEINAGITADALQRAELDGVTSHGYVKLPSYVQQVTSRKILGSAVPTATQTGPATIMVDANCGFAFPALNLATKELIKLVSHTGIACAAVFNSHHAGVLGHVVEEVADAGYLGLAFANSPAALAPPGGRTAIYGTNPVAMASPRTNGPPIVADVAMASINRSRIQVARRNGAEIPPGCARDAAGNPTTNPALALDGGTIEPIGGPKGAALALIVELLSVLSGATISANASSFSSPDGPSPKTGQLIIAFDPHRFGAGIFFSSVAELTLRVEDQGARVPGSQRFKTRRSSLSNGFTLIDETLYEEILTLSEC